VTFNGEFVRSLRGHRSCFELSALGVRSVCGIAELVICTKNLFVDRISGRNPQQRLFQLLRRPVPSSSEKRRALCCNEDVTRQSQHNSYIFVEKFAKNYSKATGVLAPHEDVGNDSRHSDEKLR